MEYCDGESLRGFMAWSFVQQCRYKGLNLDPDLNCPDLEEDTELDSVV